MLKIATALNSKMDRVIVLEEEVKVKERKVSNLLAWSIKAKLVMYMVSISNLIYIVQVLDVENEILDTERVILKKLETIMKNNISLEQQTLH